MAIFPETTLKITEIEYTFSKLGVFINKIKNKQTKTH